MTQLVRVGFGEWMVVGLGLTSAEPRTSSQQGSYLARLVVTKGGPQERAGSMVFDKVRALFKRDAPQQAPKGLTAVFVPLHQDNPDLANRLLHYVATGRDEAALMHLASDEIAAIGNWVRLWRRVLDPFKKHHDEDQVSPEQWVRLGQVLALSPRIDFDQAQWPAVPSWFNALQVCRLDSAYGNVSVWDPELLKAVLSAGGVPPERVVQAQLEGFFATLVHGFNWRGEWMESWVHHPDAPAAQAFAALVQANIAKVPPTLARSGTPTRVEAARWLSLYPELLPPLVPMLSNWAVDSSKKLREATIKLIAQLPEPLRSQTISDCLAKAPVASLPTVISQAAQMGEAGQSLLAANLGSGGKRDELLSAALNRSQVVAQTTETELAIPPVPPLDTKPLGEEYTTALLAAVDRWIISLSERLDDDKNNQWKKDTLAFARSFKDGGAEEMRAWLSGQASKPKGVRELPWWVVKDIKLPLLPAVRYSTENRSEGPIKVTWWQVDELAGPDHDLRSLVAAAELAGATDPVNQVGGRVFDWGGLKGRIPELTWPFFAEHPEWIDQAIGLAPARPSPRPYMPNQRNVALRILAMFPVLPTRYVPTMAELATAEQKTYRRQAQELLESQSTAVDIAAQTLASGKSEVRAVGASWLARIGDPAGIVPLRAALDKEKREQPQAAMLNALRLLGEDISAHLTPEVLGEAAKKGLAGKPPVGMSWFPLDALPPCRWADSTPVAPEIIRWWAVLAVKLKDPLGAGLIPLYVHLLDAPSRQALGSYVLDAWIARDIALPTDDDLRAHAAANVDARYNQYQDLGKRHPNNAYIAARAALTRDQVFDELRREKSGEHLGSAVGEKGLLALSTGAPGHHVFAACQRYIRDHGRRRAQVEALVTAASANPDPAAIQLVLSVARKYKQETVRLKAGELAEEIAERNGWSMDELADRTIPTAGFDESGLLSLDFGPRTFTGRIARSPKTDAFTIDLYNPDGKPIKALPKPGMADDETLAGDSRKQLTTSKKELTQVVTLQSVRLFEAMCLERSWSAQDWRDNLLAHPVMRHLISTLVWQSEPPQPESYALFRPTVDGELLTSDDETFDIPDGARLRLAHRATVTDEEATQWRCHLNDYQVTPLFGQFEAVAPPIPPGSTAIDDHQGWLSNTFAIRGRAAKRGYVRGDVVDSGWFGEYYKDLPGAGIRVVLEFTGSIVPEEQFPAAVTLLVFEEAGRRIPLADVPPILLAESYADYVHIAEAGVFDQDWRAKSVY